MQRAREIKAELRKAGTAETPFALPGRLGSSRLNACHWPVSDSRRLRHWLAPDAAPPGIVRPPPLPGPASGEPRPNLNAPAHTPAGAGRPVQIRSEPR